MNFWQPPADDPASFESQYDSLRMPGWELNRLWREDATNAADALHRAWSGGMAAAEAQTQAAYVQQYHGTAAAGLLSTEGLLDLGALGGAYHLYGEALQTAQNEVKQQVTAYKAGEFDAPTIAARNRRTKENYEFDVERLVDHHLGPLGNHLAVSPRRENPYQSVEPTDVEIQVGAVRAVAASYHNLAGAIAGTIGPEGPEYLLVPSETYYGLAQKFEDAANTFRYDVKRTVQGYHEIARGLYAACDAYESADSVDWFTKEQAEYDAFKKEIGPRPVGLVIE